MAQIRKYANLPDIDTAPDLYETPELTEDTSTLHTSTVRSPSPSEEGGSTDGPVDRQRFPYEQASSRFSNARVDARGVDFSDRVNGSGRGGAAGRSYRTRLSRRRRGPDDEEDDELGDFSDEEDETLERKLARLRREVEEVKAAFEERREERAKKEGEGKQEEGEEDREDPVAHVTSLSDTLDAVHAKQYRGITGAEAQFSHTLQQLSKASIPDAPAQQPFQSSSLRSQQQAHALAKAAEFDSRLSALEKSIGLDGKTMPETSADTPRPILHALSTLDAQLAAVSSATASPAFEGVARQVRQLAQEADKIAEARKSGAEGATSPTPVDDQDDAAKIYLADADRIAKINALYGTLSTIDSLAPTLPLVLERLRTLRLIHSSAGGASSVLDTLEARGEDQTREIKMWRDSLDKLEGALKGCEDATNNNVKVVGNWVRELEERVGRL